MAKIRFLMRISVQYNRFSIFIDVKSIFCTDDSAETHLHAFWTQFLLLLMCQIEIFSKESQLFKKKNISLYDDFSN